MYNTQNQFANSNLYPSHPVFQPGFAGTNTMEVRQDIAREAGYGPMYGQTTSPQNVNVGQLSQLGQVGTPFGNVQAVFQPGFAGTNPQEVRQDFGYVPTYGVSTSYQNANVGVGSFPGVNPIPVGMLGGAQAIFQPGFAGTNPQEVRQDFYPYQAAQYQQPQMTQQMYGMGLTSAPSYQSTNVPQFAGGAQAIFQPGFAGTNVQEVRALNSGYQSPSVAPQHAYGGLGYSANPSYQASTVNPFGVLPTSGFGR